MTQRYLSDVSTLTANERAFLISMINRFSDGGHPEADENNLSLFDVKFVLDMVWDVIKNNKVAAAARRLAEDTCLKLMYAGAGARS